MADEILSPHRELIATLFGQQTIPPGANPGLVFDRYLPIWNRDKGQRAEKLHPPLSAFVRAFEERAREGQPLLTRLHDRQDRLIREAGRTDEAGVTVRCTVAWRLVSGMGSDHPLENGFTMDHLTGVPFIRATALKGLCRRVSEFSGEEDGWDAQAKTALFGSPDAMASESPDGKARGDIVFLDAYPSLWPKLEVDIMNTHHQSYYRNYEKKELRETEAPCPVFFLTVASEAQFVFRLFSRTGSAANADKMKKALLEGLTLFGVGAKTAVGYGRFATPVSGGEAWLNNALKELGTQNREPDERNILRGKALATLWQAISDPVLKKEARDAIEQRWKASNLFNLGGRALRQVRQIYWGE